MSDIVRAYLRGIDAAYRAGSATEHTYRPALKALLEAMSPGVTATNEPRRIECGAPDFILTRARTPVGYVEAKDVGTNLDASERSAQMGRYRDSLSNLILTDYLEFRWYVKGERRETVRLATCTRDGKIKGTKDGMQALVGLLEKFFAQQVPALGHPKELAERMAGLARLIRDLIQETFRQETEAEMLHAQLKAFRETLIPDLTPSQFADMYAQTITYGLFAARVRATEGQRFIRESAAWNLPKTNPFLRKLFNEIAGPDLDERIAWLVDDLANLLDRADMTEVLRDFGKRARQEDPVVHFYETFLAAYDPKTRQARGVYYTPEPVVSYIVRSLDHLLKDRFARRLGLADTDTFVLDPAVGTATFLYFAIQQIHDTLAGMGQAGAWNDYVAKHLLPRVFGFELLMAPYAVAHMKLGILLQETGYAFTSDQRLGIYLTNSLEEAISQAQTLGFAGFITEEANAASDIKRETPIMVVLGNPPYSIHSANKGKHIERLMERYKAAVRREQNIQPLSDDYIKFIRFAHDRIERTGYGLIGMITNHTYLSGLIHRGMREELMKSFSEIYVLNLHGNALLGETPPDGGKDENVFDIQQGVAIALLVKKGHQEGLASVRYADLWGTRTGKYTYLLENDVNTTAWQRLEPQSTPNFFFVPKDFDLQAEYQRGWSVINIFENYSTGFETGRDCELIAFSPKDLRPLVRDLANASISDQGIAEQYGIQDTSGWPVSRRRLDLITEGFKEERIRSISYRPFDRRYTYYDDFLRRAQFENLRHLCRPNIALITSRMIKGEEPNHVFVSADPVEKIFLSPKTSNNAFVFPLYLYDEERKQKSLRGGAVAIAMTLFESQPGYATRRPNLSPKFISAVSEKLGLRFLPDGEGDLENTFGPEDVFHYIYAVFHASTYRTRYAEFLKIDFPRVPLTSDRDLFRRLCALGKELVALHLLESPVVSHLVTRYPVPGDNRVEKGHPRYLPAGEAEPGMGTPLRTGRVYINTTQYFEGVALEVWEFHVGGYQVCEKWLKDRHGCQLSYDDLTHYQKVIAALQETVRLMAEIDRAIPRWPVG